MNITAKHIASSKVIGKVKSNDVVETKTTGGLVIVSVRKNGKLETLGVGPHRAVARHIAEQSEPDLIVTELEKSATLDPAALQAVLPQWVAVTNAIRGEQ